MNEATVQEAVLDFFAQRGKFFFVDPGTDNSYESVRERCANLENCEINDSIKIGTRVPDLLGLNDQNEIIAVETKGGDDIRKGIGQANDYRRGVHKSYVATEAKALRRHEDGAYAVGIGTIPVRADGVVSSEIIEPNPNIAGTEIASMRRALALKTSGLESGRLDIPSMFRPENALLPVLAIKSEDASELSEEECEKSIKASDANYNRAPNNPIRLAKTLQLIQSDAKRTLSLTDHGQTAYTLLRGTHALEIPSIQPEDDEEENLPIGLIDTYRSHSPITAFLRDRYLATPPIRLLVKILAAQDGSRMEVSRILATIARESPDVFRVLFCSDDQEFRQILTDDDLYEEVFRERILELTQVTYLYNFVNQLVVVGILQSSSDKTDTNSDLAVDKLYWEWDPDTIGRIGAL